MFGHLDQTKLFIKNIGRGPAIGIYLLDQDDSILNFVDSSGTVTKTIEAINPPTGGKPEEQLGRIRVRLETPLNREAGHHYRLYYQDLDGRWHLTRETVSGDHFRAEFGGRISDAHP